MSTDTPNLEIIGNFDTKARFTLLLHPLGDPSCWHVFYGFDRPSLLIEKYHYLSKYCSGIFSFMGWYTWRKAMRYMKENDHFFHNDLKKTELWITTSKGLLLECMVELQQVTHIPWRVKNIQICVHAINYAFSFNNDTIVMGIRPPEILNADHRLLLLVHEFAHINLHTLPFELRLHDSLIVPAGEVLAMYFSFACIARMKDVDTSRRIKDVFMMQWQKQNLTEVDLKVLEERMRVCADKADIISAMREGAIIEILKRYRPLEYVK